MIDNDAQATIRRIADVRDVIRAISAASRLLDDQPQLIEADTLDLLTRVTDKEVEP
jgi:hypothetical protein